MLRAFIEFVRTSRDPFVIIMTAARCGKGEYDKTLKWEATDLMRQMTGGISGKVTAFASNHMRLLHSLSEPPNQPNFPNTPP
jgi:hypothetical protein